MQHLLYAPRPEYPRPDRQRGFVNGVDWINLNGPWQFRFDGDRSGVEQQWHQPGGTDWREQIIVPFCWESLAAWGEGDSAGNENYYATRVYRNPLEVNKSNHRTAARYEVGWYRKLVEIPDNAHWADKRVILTIGAADFFTDCWCEGHHLGRNEGGYTPFEFDLTDHLIKRSDGTRYGLVILRVEDPMDNHEQPVGKQWRWYTPTSGIWQTVFVEPRSRSHVDYFRTTSDIDDGSVHFEIFCKDTPDGANVQVEIIAPGDGPRSHVDIPIQNGRGEVTHHVNPMMLWEPGHPHLYNIHLSLEVNGTAVDHLKSYFGMRKITAREMSESDAPGALCLNNDPIYLRGALYQSFYPEGVYTAGDVQTIIDDLEYARKVGFDFLRIHIKVDDPLLLYHADRMGMLLMADLPNFGEGGDTPLGRRRFEALMRETIKRDFNHPSIVAWCLFNETWGFGGQVEFVKLFDQIPIKDVLARKEIERMTRPIQSEEKKLVEKLANLSAQKWVQEMWRIAKSLDDTRLIEDMSVVFWEHVEYYGHGETDINSWHFYNNDYQNAKEHIEKVVSNTFKGSTLYFSGEYKQEIQPLITSEYGGVGAMDGDRDVSWSFKWLTNELRRHNKLSAYVYTELHDVEWEYNGFLNYDRTPKEFGYDPRIINNGDVLPLNAPPISERKFGEKLRVEVCSSHYSRKRRSDITLHWELHGIDSFGSVHRNLARGWKPIPFPHGKVDLAHVVELTMPEKPMICTFTVQALCRSGEIVATNYIQFLVAEGGLPLREPHQNGMALRASPSDWVGAQWNERGCSREEARSKGFCYGGVHGFFDWVLPLDDVPIDRVRRLRVYCEASAHRFDNPQTDLHTYPTHFQIQLNGVSIHESLLPNHPHDSRGCVSYLRNGLGAYGYLAYAVVEAGQLGEVMRRQSDALTFRCCVPHDSVTQGGLTVYGFDSGRYPLPPTVVVEW